MKKSFGIISHRGNLHGPAPDQENSPTHIDNAIEKGFTVEVDVHYSKDSFFLGHDKATYPVSQHWLKVRREDLILHCKNLDALFVLKDEYHCFYHRNDDYTLTSDNLIWTYPNQVVGPDCVIVDTEYPTPTKINNWKANLFFGVCTDYPLAVLLIS